MTDKQIPRHLGFIVDGNRRWAKKNGLPTYEGHLAGYHVLKEFSLEVLKQGVEYMSAYIFSTENWTRSQEEVGKLMNLFLKLLKTDIDIFQDNDVRLFIIGSKQGLDPKIIKAIEEAEAKTANNQSGTFIMCLNYGGQLEITEAVKKIVQEKVPAEEIDTDLISNHLYASDVPPIDMIVRTGGDKRLSNFMLWRAAYAELMFIDKMWPEMTKKDVGSIIREYNKRQRRFGG